jgi:flavin-dependent dehydrogenase
VHTGTGVTALLREDGRVAGVQTQGGPLRARLVVGADGRRSTVADRVGAGKYHVAPPGRMFAWAYFEGVADLEGRIRLGQLGELAFLASPTDAGLYMAAVVPSMSVRDAFLADREGNFMAGVGGWPELADLLAGARRIGPIRLLTNWHGYFRQAVGPGWALVGDAGHFKDPSPAQGIADALRQAEHLAGAVEAGLSGATSIDDELGRWWRWRDEDAYEMHWFATDMGAAGASPPLATQLIRDISGDNEATEKLMRVLNHDIRPSQLFRPRRLGKAAVRAARDRPDQIPVMMREVASALRNRVRRSRQRHNPPRLAWKPPASATPRPASSATKY